MIVLEKALLGRVPGDDQTGASIQKAKLQYIRTDKAKQWTEEHFNPLGSFAAFKQRIPSNASKLLGLGAKLTWLHIAVMKYIAFQVR